MSEAAPERSSALAQPIAGTPSSSRLLRRLAMPAAGLESAGLETSPMAEAQERLEAAKRLLLRMAANRADVDEAVIDRMIRDAEEALRRLEGDGSGAELSAGQAFGLEAVIESDGSRPVLFVQDGRIALDGPELSDSLAARWQGAAAMYAAGISRVASAVGGLQIPAMDKRRIGTAFAIAPGLVLTNRHVLEALARNVGGAWQWKFDAEVDFIGEHDRPGENRFRLAEVALAGPNPINGSINFANLDVAVLRVEGDLSRFPSPLSFETVLDRVKVGAGAPPPVYVVGFPARPADAPGSPADGVPGVGHEYQEVLEKLYGNRGFGSKRWAPGLVEAGAGQLAGDARRWVMSHDASTLGGNSGSCVVDFANNGERVVGLHFGGRPRVENYAHVVAALQGELQAIHNVAWI